MTRRELLDLPAAVDLVTAARALGIGRTKAHDLAKSGEFPCRVLRVGPRYRVPTSGVDGLLAVLGIDEEARTT